MKGLLIKDFRLIAHSKRMFISWVVVMLLALQNYDNYGFLIGYSTMIFMMFILNTIALDEYDKSCTFLMTLPIKRETYVTEKYLLMLSFSLLGTVLSTIICSLLHREMTPEILLTALILYVVIVLFQMIMLPLQLKFGGDKGRIMLIGLLACVAALAALFGKVTSHIFGIHGEIGNGIRNAVTWFFSLSVGRMLLIFFPLSVVWIAVSYSISRRIMQNKEF